MSSSPDNDKNPKGVGRPTELDLRKLNVSSAVKKANGAGSDITTTPHSLAAIRTATTTESDVSDVSLFGFYTIQTPDGPMPLSGYEEVGVSPGSLIPFEEAIARFEAD